MVNTLSGSVCAYRKETVKPRFIRIDEVNFRRNVSDVHIIRGMVIVFLVCES